jgi:hypothetical protein
LSIEKSYVKRLRSPLYSNKVFLNLRHFLSAKVKEPKDHNGFTRWSINKLKAIERMMTPRRIKLQLDIPEGIQRHLQMVSENKTLTILN